MKRTLTIIGFILYQIGCGSGFIYAKLRSGFQLGVYVAGAIPDWLPKNKID